MKLIDNVSLGASNQGEDELLAKKIDELNGSLKSVRQDIAELKADQDTIEVRFFPFFFSPDFSYIAFSFPLKIQNPKKNRWKFKIFQKTNQNLVSEAQKLVNTRQGEFEEFFGKLEEKLNQFYITDNSKSEFEEKVSTTIGSIKSNVEELKTLLGSGLKTEYGLSEVDRQFIQELSNDTVKSIVKNIDEAKSEIVADAGKSESQKEILKNPQN